jgi:hypothetical protein
LLAHENSTPCLFISAITIRFGLYPSFVALKGPEIQNGQRSLLDRNSLSGRDFRAANKGCVLVDYESRRLNVSAQCAASLKLATFARKNIAPDRPLDLHRFRSDLAPNLRVLPDRERATGINGPFYLTVNQQLFSEFDRACDGDPSRENSAS